MRRRAIISTPLLLLLLTLSVGTLSAQDSAEVPLIDSSKFTQPIPLDSFDPRPPQVDQLGNDSIRVGISPSGRDEDIVYSADSIIFSLNGKKAYLYGNADVTTNEDRLRAAYIEIDFETSELYASVVVDSATGRESGYPLLEYGGETLSARTLKYNFETGRGVSTEAEIAIEEGYIQVERFKRVSEDIVFAQNGRFTTCEDPHPHYYFEADRMKLLQNDLIFADKMQLYIEDVPVLTLPIGFFFALGGGRNSGLLLPSFRQSSSRGLELQGLGYYLIINDYFDTKLTTDLSTRGGYNIDNLTRYRLRGKVTRADLQTRLGFTRDVADEPLTRSVTLQYWHNQSFSPVTSLSGNLYYSTTTDPFRKTNPVIPGSGTVQGENQFELSNQNEFDDVTKRLITSNLSLNSMVSPFGIDLPFSVGYSRSLDIVTNEVDPEEYSARISPRAWTPFARGGPDILSTLSLQVQPGYRRRFVRKDTVEGGGFANVQTAQGINLSPTVSLNPRFGYFTISPRLQTNASVFFRRIQKQMNAAGGIDTTYYDGLYAPFWYNYGVTASTTLYGVIQPRIFGINAIRHRLSPSIGISINPDFSDPKYGYFDEFFNPKSGRLERYSIFEADRATASAPGFGESRSITYGLNNSFEAKIAQGDTLEDRKVTLLNIDLNGSYNLADSLKPVGPLRLSASSNLASIGNLSATATMTPYRRDAVNTETGFTLANQKGIGVDFPWVRVTNASMTFSSTISDEGFRTERFISQIEDSAATFGARRHTFDGRDNSFDADRFYGREIRGDDAFRIPWRATFTGTYSLTPGVDTTITNFYINTSLSLSLTPTTEISGSGSYDLNAGRFNVPSLTLTKDLHDWILRVTYVPNGFAEQFTISIGFKPSLLRDLEQEFRF